MVGFKDILGVRVEVGFYWGFFLRVLGLELGVYLDRFNSSGYSIFKKIFFELVFWEREVNDFVCGFFCFVGVIYIIFVFFCRNV